MVWGGFVYMAWIACTSGKTPLMLNDICCHSDNTFFKEGLAYFNKTMLNCVHAFKLGFVVQETRCRTGPQFRPVTHRKHLAHLEI